MVKVDLKNIKLEEKTLLERFISNRKLTETKDGYERREATIKAYRSDISTFLGQVSEITGIDRNKEIELVKKCDSDFVESWNEQVALKMYTRKTYNRKIQHLNVFFDYVCNNKHIVKYNPFEHIKQLKVVQTRDVKQKEVLSTEELKMLIEDTRVRYKGERDWELVSSRDRFLIALNAVTGLRLGEAINLSFEDLTSIEEGYEIFIPASRVKNKIDKKVPCVGKVYEYLQEYLIERKYIHVENESDKDLIFLSNRGKKLTEEAINKSLKKRTKRLGINKDITSHCLRHGANSLLLGNGISKSIINTILGWKEGDISSVYTHDTKELQKLKIEACNKILGA